MRCSYVNDGVQCTVGAVGAVAGSVDFTCSPGGGNPSCSGTFQGIDRINNSCIQESIRVVLFSWQEGPAPGTEGAAPASEGA